MSSPSPQLDLALVRNSSSSSGYPSLHSDLSLAVLASLLMLLTFNLSEDSSSLPSFSSSSSSSSSSSVPSSGTSVSLLSPSSSALGTEENRDELATDVPFNWQFSLLQSLLISDSEEVLMSAVV